MDNCFFCSLVNSQDVYELENTKFFRVLLDVNPSVMGQSLILSKQHQPFFPALSLEEVVDFLSLLNKLKLSYYSMGEKNFNVLINNGVGAGQKVAHFSASYFPRTKGDNFSMFNLSFLNITNDQFQKQVNSFKNLFSQINLNQIDDNSFINNDDSTNSKDITNKFKPKNILLETKNYYVFLDENQYSPGHIKILPKYLDYSIKSLKELANLLKIVPIVLFQGLKPKGTNILFDFFENNFLIHIIPRYENDFSFIINSFEYDLGFFLEEYNKKKNNLKSFVELVKLEDKNLIENKKDIQKNDIKKETNNNKELNNNKNIDYKLEHFKRGRL